MVDKEPLEVTIARLQEKFNNLRDAYQELRERQRFIQQDLIKKSEEIKENSNENKNLERELNRIQDDLEEELSRCLKIVSSVNEDFTILKRKVYSELETLQELKKDKTTSLVKLFITILTGIGGIIGSLFGLGIIKF